MTAQEIVTLVVTLAPIVPVLIHALKLDDAAGGKIINALLPDIVGFIKAIGAALSKGGGPPAASGSPPQDVISFRSVPPPPRPPVAKLSIVALAMALGGCAAAKPACGLVRIANEACDLFLVTLPDGTVEKLPAEDIRRFAVQHKRTREALEKVERGGQ